MGFHTCEYCEASNVIPEHSSGDVTLRFDDGKSYEVPDMILHYVIEHGYVPPENFLLSVMAAKLIGGARAQTKSPSEKIGYLAGPYKATEGTLVARAFQHDLAAKLSRLLREAAANGEQRRTRGS